MLYVNKRKKQQISYWCDLEGAERSPRQGGLVSALICFLFCMASSALSKSTLSRWSWRGSRNFVDNWKMLLEEVWSA